MVKSLIDVIHRQGLITILVVLWTLGIVTFVTIQVFSDTPPDIPGGTVTAFGAVLSSILAVGFTFYKWRIGKPDDSD